MSRALGDECAEMQAHILADEIFGFRPNIPFLRVVRIESVGANEPLVELFETQRNLSGKFLFQGWIEILTVVPQGGEPCKVVDASALPLHFPVGNVRVVSQKIAGALHGMAEPDYRKRAGAPGGEAHYVHRVRVVQHDRFWAKPFRILQNFQKNRHGAERFEKPARPNRVTDALVHAVFQRNVVVELHAFETADLDAIHNVVASGEDLPSVLGGLDFPVRLSQLSEEFADDLGHRGEPGAVDIHQSDRPAAFAGCLQNIVEQAGSEPAASAEHSDFQRTGKLSREC